MTIQALLYGPHAGVLTHNFYVAVCSHPVYYGSGYVGMFMFLFIYSKLFEMVDTVFLTLRKNPVRLLHWCVTGDVGEGVVWKAQKSAGSGPLCVSMWPNEPYIDYMEWRATGARVGERSRAADAAQERTRRKGDSSEGGEEWVRKERQERATVGNVQLLFFLPLFLAFSFAPDRLVLLSRLPSSPNQVPPCFRTSVLLALVQHAHQLRPLVRRDELPRPRVHVLLLCHDTNQRDDQGYGAALRDVPHAPPATADGRRYRRHGRLGSVFRRSEGRVPREFDEHSARPADVLFILRPLRPFVPPAVLRAANKGQGGEEGLNWEREGREGRSFLGG